MRDEQANEQGCQRTRLQSPDDYDDDSEEDVGDEVSLS